MIYTLPYQTRWHDTDANRTVRPSQILVYMQETSNQQVAHMGMTLDELRDTKHLAFILSKIRIAFYRPLHAFEDIEVQTWTTPARGYSSFRCFRIMRDGEVIAEADSTWALIDVETHRLCKPNETGYPNEDEAPLTLDLPGRIHIPHDCPWQKAGERKIVYSDLDYNMHMNNTRYPDLLCDYLPPETVKQIRGMTLSYLHEAAYGQTMTVWLAKQHDSYYFRTINEEGTVCLEAQIQIS